MTTEKSSVASWLLAGIAIFYIFRGIVTEVLNKRGFIPPGSQTHEVMCAVYRPLKVVVSAIPGGDEAAYRLISKLAGK